MAIVYEKRIGNAVVKIDDKYIEKDPVKRKKLMEESYEMCMRMVYNLPQENLDAYVDYMEKTYGSDYVAEYRAHQKKMQQENA